jgi:hypothetical protein
MKNRFLNFLKKPVIAIAILLFVFSMGVVNAQPANTDLDEPDLPLDGGLSLLLAAGAALGGKKVYDMRKKKAKDQN